MADVLYDHIMVRYGELTTKGKNRKEFERKLTENVKKRLKDYPKLKYNRTFDGLFIILNGEDYNLIKEDLKQVFGYSYFAGTMVVPKDIDTIAQAAYDLCMKKDYKTFKISSRRNDKSYPMHSDEINRKVATYILKNTEIKVDVHNPDITIYIVIKEDGAYILDEKIYGPGGYPTGINGRAMHMMSGGIDSPVAGYLTMKRGMTIECLHFASQPYTSKQALDKVLALSKQLSYYQENVLVHIIPFTDLQLAIYQNCDESYAITIMRRMMYRIADRLVQARHMSMITNGESVGQVASQTPESIKVIEHVCDSLILRPVCMMDKQEIIDVARKIGTYETSILPYEDCCTIFDPKNPVTKPKLDRCEYFESKFDWESLVDKCIEGDNVVKVSYRDVSEDIF